MLNIVYNDTTHVKFIMNLTGVITITDCEYCALSPIGVL